MITRQLKHRTRIALSSFMIVASSASMSRLDAQDPAGDRRASVVLLDFGVSALTEPATWAPLATGIPHIFMTELSRNPDLRLIERSRLQAVLDELKLTPTDLVDPTTAARVGKIIGARYMVYGGVNIDPKKKLRLDVHAFKVETTVHEPGHAITGKADDVLDIIAQLAQTFSKEFDPTPFDAAPTGRNSRHDAKPTKEGLRLAMLLGNAVNLRDRKDVDGAKALVRQALALVPDNPSAVAMMSSLEQDKP